MLVPFLVACSITLARAPADPRAELEARLAEVEELLQARKWEEAREELLGALEVHGGQDHVLAHWPAIEEALALTAFWSSYEPPEPADVIDGELLSWRPRTSSIKLRYRSEHASLAGPVEDGRCGDFVVTGERSFTHPAVFSGRHTIEIRGSSLAGGRWVPSISFARHLNPSKHGLFGELCEVRFGSLASLRRRAIGSTASTQLDSAPLDIDRHKSYRFKVGVSTGGMTASYNGKPLLRAKVEELEPGQFGFSDFVNVEEVLVSGEIDPSWITGLVDARVQEDWERFSTSFDSLREVPAELAERVAGEARSAREFGEDLPNADVGDRAGVDQVVAHFRQGDMTEGLAALDALDEEEVPEVTRGWLRAMLQAYSGRLAQAAAELDRVLESVPDFYEGRLLRMRLVRAMESDEDLDRELAALVRDFPDCIEPYEEQARVRLFRGDREAAREVMEQAVENGIPAQALRRIGKTLSRADHGPRWGDAYVHETKNYIIASDMGRAACLRIGAELEEYYREYNHHLRRVEEEDLPKARVFFFSGKAGYRSYTEDLLGFPAENTLGLYSPALKQLLIWNSADEETVMRTVRHEGFHQYFDRLLEVEAPVWLNEGLGEYFEQASYERARWRADQVNETHVGILRATVRAWTPLDYLVQIDNGAFRARSALHYPQSWALVHYLQNGDRDLRDRFDALIDALVEGAGRKEAVDRAFEGIDWREFERDFRDYVAGLE